MRMEGCELRGARLGDGDGEGGVVLPLARVVFPQRYVGREKGVHAGARRLDRPQVSRAVEDDPVEADAG